MSRRNQGTTASGRQTPPAFPTRQMLVLALCRICEPIAFTSIFPYIYFMVKDFHATEDESKISFYSGLVTSAFTFAEFSTGLLWGRLSDKVGRKPVLLMGLAGTGLSSVVFGLSPNLAVALVARALGGLLNGNVGVLQTTVAELVTVKEHQPRAYTIMPLVWCLGSIVGPMIGGALARPVDNFPSIFTPGSVWERFPYLLPNLFCAFCVFLSLAVGILFLEETHAEKKLGRDCGLELGARLMARWFPDPVDGPRGTAGAKIDERQPLVRTEETPFRYDALASRAGAERAEESAERGPCCWNTTSSGLVTDLAKPKTRVFTRTVVLNIVSYGILAFHTMTFDSLFPVFLEDPPKHDASPSLPFKFSGGFGYDTATVGFILSVQGAYSMLSTVALFPWVAKRLGALRLFRLIAASYFLLYFLTPYTVLLPDHLRMAGIYMLLVWKCTLSTLAYPANAILLANSALSTLTLGTINGVAASTASLCRAFGPIVSGFLFALGGRAGYAGLVWWVSGLISLAGAVVSFQMAEAPGRLDEKAQEEGAGPVAVAPSELPLRGSPRDEGS